MSDYRLDMENRKLKMLVNDYELELKRLNEVQQKCIEELEKKLARAHLDGIAMSIQSLRALQDKTYHLKEWNHSCDVKFAPVELSDWLLINLYRKEEK